MYQYKYPHPAVTVDIVVFTIADGRLKVLLIRRKHAPYRGRWTLPGGFVEINESLDAAAARELQEETGIRDACIEQLHTFGAPKRDPRERVITVAYLSVIPSQHVQLNAGSDAEAARWFEIDDLPRLGFDHADILELAYEQLLVRPDDSALFLKFLPEQFTLTELQKVFEIIRQQNYDKRNFRKWILNSGCVEDTGNLQRGGVHRPAKLYRTATGNCDNR